VDEGPSAGEGHGRGGHISKPDEDEARAAAATAEALVEVLRELERIAGRVGEVELAGWKDISRAGELLGKATDAHGRFVQHLGVLTRTVETLRDRHNRAADALARAAERVDGSRRAWETLQARFADLGQAALDIDGELRAASGRSEEELRATLAAVRARLATTVGTATEVATEARAAGLTDLERRGDAVRQQLEAMLDTVTRATGSD